MNAAEKIELAQRSIDGLDVTLWWSPAEDEVTVEVLHFETESLFELRVERSRALEAFYHPFAYAARREPELLDLAA